MTDAGPPKGVRHSLLYVERGERLEDNLRARRRIFALLERFQFQHSRIQAGLREELGAKVWSHNFHQFFESAERRDFLDSVTICAQQLGERGHVFVSEAQRIFEEENLAYRIDGQGGVHPLVDTEFVRGVEATIAALSTQRFQAARTYFEQALEDFSGTAPDGKAAIRHIFLSAETVFKLIAPGNPQRLGTGELRAMLSAVQAQAGADRTAKLVAEKALDGFSKWVEAAHFYRHAQKEEEPSQPPLPLVIFMLSTGAANIRWLASLGTGEN
jgi:hypothetical protein